MTFVSIPSHRSPRQSPVRWVVAVSVPALGMTPERAAARAELGGGTACGTRVPNTLRTVCQRPGEHEVPVRITLPGS